MYNIIDVHVISLNSYQFNAKHLAVIFNMDIVIANQVARVWFRCRCKYIQHASFQGGGLAHELFTGS